MTETHAPDNRDEPSRFILTIFQTGLRKDDRGVFARSVVDEIKHLIEPIIGLGDCAGQLDVWLESPGGDANAAYKLHLFLRSRFKKIRVIIPDYAKSAATLFAFGCDEIFMAPDAELGPLDVQIEHPDREGVTVSGLDVAKALSFVCDYASSYLVSAGYELYRSTELPRREVLNQVSSFAATLLQPAIAKLDPHIIHKAANELEIAQDYASRMLRERSLDAADEERAFPPGMVAHHFINHYPAHDFVISRIEARQFGLPVHDLEDYDLAHEMLAKHAKFRSEFHPDMPNSIIEITPLDDEAHDNEANATDPNDPPEVRSDDVPPAESSSGSA